MPRFLFEEGTSSKFWQIDLDGAAFTVAWGKIGTAGQSQVKSCGSPAEAQAEYDKLIREKTKKGYALAGDGARPPASPRPAPAAKAPRPGGNPELEANVADNPDDVNAYLVYADWLQSTDDPLGEFVALSCRAASDPVLKKLANKQLKLHEKTWLGALAEHTDLASLEWRNGFIESARVTMEFEGDPHAKKLLTALLKLPTCQFLRSLTLGLYYDEAEEYEVNYNGAGKVLVAHGPMPSLRSLFIGDFDYPDETEISWAHLGNLGGVWALYPNLKTLRLRGGDQKLGAINLPNLQEFTIETGGLTPAALKSIAAAQWPSIERISIWCGREDYGWKSKAKDLLPLLERTDLPKLRHLGLKNSEIGDELPALLARTPLLRQLDELDLSMSTFGDAGAEALLANAPAFTHLTLIDVSESYLTPPVAARLHAVFPAANVKGQRKPDDWGSGELHRYCSVGE